MNLKQNKGITLTDGIIAVVILMIFTGVVISIAYHIYIQSNYIKRNEQATNYVVEVFEHAQGLIFDNVVPDNLIKYINNKYDNIKAVNGQYYQGTEIQAGYTMFINVIDKYPNYIKQLDITIMYKLGGKDRIVNMSTLINK